MKARILDLDGSILAQANLLRRFEPAIHDLRDWGPTLRMGCSFRRFRQFEAVLAKKVGSLIDEAPALSFVGSGDFHHVSLGLVRRIANPFNLLIIDNHPDWMRHIPFMHCGTWVHHASRLPNLRSIFHLGGDVDFDNLYRLLAPWQKLHTGKIRVIPAVREYVNGGWKKLYCSALRVEPDQEATAPRIDEVLEPFRLELEQFPLYISLDKDVLTSKDALVNWDSGHLSLREVLDVLGAFTEATQQPLLGLDIVGDWSPVRLSGWGRKLLHLTEHPAISFTPEQAMRRNERTNIALLQCLNVWEREQVRAADLVADGTQDLPGQ